MGVRAIDRLLGMAIVIMLCINHGLGDFQSSPPGVGRWLGLIIWATIGFSIAAQLWKGYRHER